MCKRIFAVLFYFFEKPRRENEHASLELRKYCVINNIKML